MTDQFKLVSVRLSFPDIWVPKSLQANAEPKYGCSFLIDKATQGEQIKELKELILAAAKAKWPGKVKELTDKKKLHFCLHEGSEKDYDGYSEDNMFLTASSKKRPLIVDRDRTPLAEQDSRPYAGCYVDAIVRIWVQDNDYGKRVNAELMGVQFVKDGDPFGAGPINPDAFTDHSAGEGAGDTRSGAEKEATKEKSAKAPKDDDDSIAF